MRRPGLIYGGMAADDVDWVGEDASLPARIHLPGRLNDEPQRPVEQSSTPPAPRRKLPGPRCVTSEQVVDRYGEAALEWLEGEWHAGRIVKHAKRWLVSQRRLGELLARRPGAELPLGSHSRCTLPAQTTPEVRSLSEVAPRPGLSPRSGRPTLTEQPEAEPEPANPIRERP